MKHILDKTIEDLGVEVCIYTSNTSIIVDIRDETGEVFDGSRFNIPYIRVNKIRKLFEQHTRSLPNYKQGDLDRKLLRGEENKGVYINELVQAAWLGFQAAYNLK